MKRRGQDAEFVKVSHVRSELGLRAIVAICLCGS